MLELTTLNKISVGLILLAKFAGFMAVAVGFAGMQTLGISLIAIAVISLITVFIFCGYQLNQQNKQDEADKDILRKMLLDGSLLSKLKEIGYIKEVKVNNEL